MDDDHPYYVLIRNDDTNLEELIEFQDKLSNKSLLSIPESDEMKYNDLLCKELKDKYNGVRVMLPRGDRLNETVILNRKRTADGSLLIGEENNNPILDTWV